MGGTAAGTTTTWPDPAAVRMPDAATMAARQAVVAEHMRAEMAGELDACLATFAGDEVSYDIVPLGALVSGAEAVRDLLTGLLTAFPDLGLHVVTPHHSPDALIIEGLMTGTHLGPYGPVAATGRPMRIRAAVFFRFDPAAPTTLVNETVYYDEADLLRQLGADGPPPRA